jgi:TorA maturation chaperone TorD
MQTTNPTIPPSAAVRAARQEIYRLLALCATDPRAERWPGLADPDLQESVQLGAETLVQVDDSPSGGLAPGELGLEYLEPSALLSFINSTSREKLAEAHDQIFGLVLSKECPPYESEYSSQSFSVSRSHRMADVAGFFRAFGVEASDDHRERPDHVALELEFMSWLIAKETRALESGEAEAEERARICHDAQKKFFTEHLGWWLPAFAMALRHKAGDKSEPPCAPENFHTALGSVLAAFTAVERMILDIEPPKELAPRNPLPTETADFDEGCSGCELASK